MNFRMKKNLNLSCKYSYILLVVVGYTCSFIGRESDAMVGRGVSSVANAVRSSVSRIRPTLQRGINVSFPQNSSGVPDRTKPRVSFINHRGKRVKYHEPLSPMEKLLVDDSKLHREKYIDRNGDVKTYLIVKDINRGNSSRRSIKYKVKKKSDKFVPNLPTIPE